MFDSKPQAHTYSRKINLINHSFILPNFAPVNVTYIGCVHSNYERIYLNTWDYNNYNYLGWGNLTLIVAILPCQTRLHP